MMRKSLSHLSPPKLNASQQRLSHVCYSVWSALLVSCVLWGCGGAVERPQNSQNVEREESSVARSEGKTVVIEPELGPVPPGLPRCAPSQSQLYQENATRLTRYVRRFIKEISKINDLKGNLDLKLRRSRVMIAFGEDLIRRIGFLEATCRCLPLYQRYLRDRAVIFRELESLVQAQSPREARPPQEP